jgi:hypothetical protein
MLRRKKKDVRHKHTREKKPHKLLLKGNGANAAALVLPLSGGGSPARAPQQDSSVRLHSLGAR